MDQVQQQKELPKRSEVEKQYQWQLEHIYATDALWEQEFAGTLAMLKQVGAYQGKLGQSAPNLLAALQLQDQISLQTERIYTYARMRRDEDNTNTTYQSFVDRATNLSAQVQAALSFYLPEILAIPTGTLKDFLQQEPKLGLYGFALEEIQRQKPHVLSAPEEQILAGVSEVTQAGANIFTMLNNADITFPSIKDENGFEVAVTHGRYIKFLESSNRQVRRDAYDALYGSYRQLINTIAATLGASVKKDVFYAKTRRHPSALEAALFADNITVDVYDNLVNTVRQNLNHLHRYIKIRKKLLDLNELHMYDLYTPLVPEIKWKINYNEAMDFVAKGMAPLGHDYVTTMLEGFENGWVDVHENKGKTSGAYSWGPYGVHPYVLLNYQGHLNDVFTLAHEMGHAMHSYYSHAKQPYIYAHYKIFTAEVASTVNETLLVQHLLKTITDKNKKLYLINHYLEQFRGTVFRQTMFAEFEKIIHAQVEAGQALTPDALGQIYRQLNVDYYGPEIVVDDNIALEWARIPHFYRAFYVYKYATGFSAATALAQQILNQGQPAVTRYITFLQSGDSDYPINLLQAAGVDMSSPEPVQKALALFGQMLDEFETLTGAE